VLLSCQQPCVFYGNDLNKCRFLHLRNQWNGAPVDLSTISMHWHATHKSVGIMHARCAQWCARWDKLADFCMTGFSLCLQIFKWFEWKFPCSRCQWPTYLRAFKREGIAFKQANHCHHSILMTQIDHKVLLKCEICHFLCWSLPFSTHQPSLWTEWGQANWMVLN
jgi:hypothetical protein